MMNQEEFEYNISRAEEFHRLSTGLEIYFWEGYLHGLRRHFHGDRFGTDSNHILWLNLKTENHDFSRKYRAVGYSTGFEGIPVSEAIHRYEKIQRRQRRIFSGGSARK